MVKNLPTVQENWVWFLDQEWLPTPVFLPAKFLTCKIQRSLVGYSPCSHKELDMTEWLTESEREWMNSIQNAPPSEWRERLTLFLNFGGVLSLEGIYLLYFSNNCLQLYFDEFSFLTRKGSRYFGSISEFLYLMVRGQPHFGSYLVIFM